MNKKCPKCGNMTLRKNGANTPGGKERWMCGRSGAYCYGTTNPDAPARNQRGNKVEVEATAFRRSLPEAQRYIITCAQNATPVHAAGLKTLQIAAKHLRAELVVIPIRYKNPTSMWTQSQANAETWDDAVAPYLFGGCKKLNANLILVGDVKVIPTATRPLSGFEGLTHSESCILGHTKIEFKVIPTMAGKHPKILTTTGAITQRNYTDSKAGALGQFHHSLGALMVEIKNDKIFHLRQLVLASDGSFTDLDKSYDTAGVRPAAAALGLVMGDSHLRFLADGVKRATFGKDGMVELLNPTTLVWHDALDGHTHNPHHDGNPFIEAAIRSAGMDDVRAEVEETVAFIDQMTGAHRNSVIVPDNHGDFLRRWIVKSDWRELSGKANKAFYLETAKVMLDSAALTKNGVEYDSPFAYWVGRLATNPGVRALAKDEVFMLARFACHMHGHIGPNGARGSILNLSRLGALVISGHGHTPGWEEGHRRVGTSANRAEYEEGPSSHMHTHCVVYASGASSLLTIIGDEYRV